MRVAGEDLVTALIDSISTRIVLVRCYGQHKFLSSINMIQMTIDP
jgi:hypothetical protein